MSEHVYESYFRDGGSVYRDAAYWYNNEYQETLYELMERAIMKYKVQHSAEWRRPLEPWVAVLTHV